MDKALREHIKIMESKLLQWEAHPDEIILKDIVRTYRHHRRKVHDFQHERLIHLLITLFFGLLFLVSLVLLFTFQFMGLPVVALLGLILAAILLVTELFYIRYYFFLENGVQKLYTIDDRFAALPLDSK